MKQISTLTKAALVATAMSLAPQEMSAQAAVTCTPAMSTGCTANDYINAFVLNGIAAVGNAACNGAANGYTLYPTPIWNLNAGNTYTWSAQTNGTGGNQAVAIWIDLNNDGFYTSTEQLANTAAAANHLGSFLIPTTATGANNVRMRVRCKWNSMFGTGNNEACAGYTWGETEDYYVNIIPPTPCSVTPVTNTVVVPSYSICPNTGAGLSLATSYTETGLTYQWYASNQSALGNYTAITSGTNPALSTGNLTQNTWYQVVITCTNAGPSASVSATELVMVSPVVVDSVPYFEGFEGIVQNNMLPNCSWSATSLPTISQTYTLNSNYNRVPHTGSNFASFRYGTGTGGQFFYSNGIYLQAGITYSAGAWYIADGLLGWQEFSLYYNTTQTSTGLTAIASKTGAVTNVNYQLLSDTFSVPSTGVYYLAVKGRDNGSPWYLTWDDLFVTIPCEFNSPSLSVSASATNVCEGTIITVNATGAESYLWSNGDITPATSYTATAALAASGIHVSGTNTLSGCGDNASIAVVVNERPEIGIIPSTASICPGASANLVAYGATTYTWNDLSTNPVKAVNPIVSTLYSVIGANASGCTDQASYMVNVFTQPIVMVGSTQPSICAGEVAELEATGAVTYQWMANTAFIQDNPAYVSPNASTNYTVVGTDENGCSDSEIVSLVVDPCTGIATIDRSASLNLFPNPSNGEVSVVRSNNSPASIQVIDVTGRVVMSREVTEANSTIDVSGLANGVYYVKVTAERATAIEKLIKE